MEHTFWTGTQQHDVGKKLFLRDRVHAHCQSIPNSRSLLQLMISIENAMMGVAATRGISTIQRTKFYLVPAV